MFSVMCFCMERERKQRERDGEDPRAASSARMSPTGLSLGGSHACGARFRFTRSGCSAQVPERSISAVSFPDPTNPCKVSSGWLQRKVILPGFLADEALLGSLGNGQLGGALGALRALHDFLAQLVVTQRAAALR